MDILLWSEEVLQYSKIAELYPDGVFQEMTLTGRQNFGHLDSGDFGFIHLRPDRLDIEGQQSTPKHIRRPGKWKITCKLVDTRNKEVTGDLCFQ